MVEKFIPVAGNRSAMEFIMTTESGIEEAAAQSTSALGPLVGIAREDFIEAYALLLRSVVTKPGAFANLCKSIGIETAKILTGKSKFEPNPKDKRFHDPAWRTSPIYRATLQYYLAVQENVQTWLDDLELKELERNRASFMARFLLDGLAPTNTLIGNPTAIKRLVDSGGGSLIKGIRNAYQDIVNNRGLVSLVDKRSFKLGENIATSKGAVVYRTEMFELIQYSPTTERVRAIPQVTIPPQINKMYIHDLAPDKSVVKYQLDHGIQTFVISWRNPSKEQGVWNLENYVNCCEQAMQVAAKITGSKRVNISAGCSGGQTAAVLASKLAADRSDLLGALTLMVCVLHPDQLDTEAGSLVSDNGKQLMRNRAVRAGVITADELTRGFAFLRPNDLIWNYVVNNYLMGDDPPAYDLLFWNSDATNLSASLMGDFLTLFETLAFTKKGEVEAAGHMIDLSKVTSDLFILGGATDHITPWKATYRSTQLFGSEDITFVLSQSGHMQAILNPPDNPRARYFIQEKGGILPETADDWLEGAQQRDESWWPLWIDWLASRSGEEKLAPMDLGNREFRPSDPAPGLNVIEER